MDKLRNNEELRKLFKKKGWVRVCRECGEFVGNTANWIEHNIKTHIKKEPARMNRLELSSELVLELVDELVDELSSEVVLELVL